jgi:MFS family permease
VINRRALSGARLGTALRLITLIQALGMAASNLAAGWLADQAGAGARKPAGYAVMLGFFFLLSLVALSSASEFSRLPKFPRADEAS